MASGRFELVRKSDNSIQKLKGKLSEKKEINITSLNGKAYVHLSDLKNVKEGAKFTKTNVKQVSLNMEEISVLTSYLLNIEPQVQEFLQQIEAQENSPPYQPDVRPISPPPATLPIPWGAPAPYQPQEAAAPYQSQGRAPTQYQPQTLYQQHFGAYGVPQQPTTTTYGVPGYAVQPMMEATYNGQGVGGARYGVIWNYVRDVTFVCGACLELYVWNSSAVARFSQAVITAHTNTNRFTSLCLYVITMMTVFTLILV